MSKIFFYIFVAISLICLIFIISNDYQSVTLNELLIQYDFDIKKVEGFHLEQYNYNWRLNILSLSETTDPQKIYDYISQISKKKVV